MKKKTSAIKDPKRVFLFFVLGMGLFLCQAPAFAEKESSSGLISFFKKSLKVPANLYQILSDDEDVLARPEFHVIDDFNSGELKNKMGNLWETKIDRGAALEISYDRKDARYQRRGHSIKLDFNLPRKRKVFLKSSLGILDMSQTQTLTFKGIFEEAIEVKEKRKKIKGKENSKEKVLKAKFSIILEDSEGHRVKAPITTKLIEKSENQSRWRDIVIPLYDFDKLDLNQLVSVGLEVQAKRDGFVGSIWLDDFAFWGHGQIGFESKRDNLVDFPAQVYAEERTNLLWGKARQSAYQKVFLREVAADTWKYFLNARDKKTHLVVDHIRVGKYPLVADYTSITNIAMDFLATVAAYDLGFIDRDAAVGRIQETLGTLQKLERWNGFFYNFYNTTNLKVGRKFISSVDSGWLAISLVVVRQAFREELWDDATKLLDEFDFSQFLDAENNQLVIGYDTDKKEWTPHHYGLIASEARATSLYAIGKGDLPKEHWWFIYRTPPAAWEWQEQKPRGKMVSREGIDYFQGHYEYEGKKFVPSWGGSLFEYLMPTLVLKEATFAKNSFGLNNKTVTELHKDYALKEKKYRVWGISPSATSSGRGWNYGEYGIKKFSVKGYADRQVITPHVTFLALDSLPKEAILNARNLLNYKSYGEYGYYDTVDLRREEVNTQYLALDQGMTLVAICNYLKGSIQNRFHDDSVGKIAEELWLKESFFKQ